MANIPGRAEPKLGPSDSSDTASDRPNEASTDSDSADTGERVTVGRNPQGEDRTEYGVDRRVGANEAGLGAGLDQAEEAQLGITDEEMRDSDLQDDEEDSRSLPRP
jgi:hypothetical protein